MTPEDKTPYEFKSEVNALNSALAESGVEDAEERRRISQVVTDLVTEHYRGGDPEATDEEELLSQINRVMSDGMTDEERALKSFTRQNLKRLSNWETDWRQAFYEQLDAHDKDGTFGEPCKAPPGATIVRPHWATVVKASGKRKARLCCDGSKKMAPSLHCMGNTYASCIEQPCL